MDHRAVRQTDLVNVSDTHKGAVENAALPLTAGRQRDIVGPDGRLHQRTHWQLGLRWQDAQRRLYSSAGDGARQKICITQKFSHKA